MTCPYCNVTMSSVLTHDGEVWMRTTPERMRREFLMVADAPSGRTRIFKCRKCHYRYAIKTRRTT